MDESVFADILTGPREGSVVPYLGPGVLDGVVNSDTGEPMPADSDDLILAMNDGRSMAPRLMYEFSRAAMNMELKREIDQERIDMTHPIIFKPLGAPCPKPSFIASDADFVDYITQLMGGFAIPACLKTYRQGKRYLLLGLRLTRDTERMVLSDIIYGAASPAGWALIPDPTPKERRFCEKLGIEIIQAHAEDLLVPELARGIEAC